MKVNINKKNLIMIIVPILVFVFIIILLISLLDNTSDSTTIRKEYQELNGEKSPVGLIYPEVKISKNNIMRYTSNQEIIDIMNNNKDAVIYFGYPSCVYCRTAIEVLLNTAEKTELDEILYLNTQKEAPTQELLNKLGTEFIENDNNIANPLVIFITDGAIVSYNKQTLFSHIDPYKELDASQLEGLSTIYKYGIRDVINSKNLKK